MVLRGVEVDDRGHPVDVDAAGGHVGGNQGVYPSLREVGQCPSALSLAAAAVDGSRLDPGLAELSGQPVGSVPGPAEDDCGPRSADGVGGDIPAIRLGDVPEDVMGRRDVGGLLADLVAHRIALVVACQPGHVAVEGGREQHGLAEVGCLVEQATDGRHEAHVGHAVRLVEHHHVYLREAQSPLLDEVLEAPGAGDQDVDPAPEGLQLGAVADTAVDDVDPDGSGEGAQLGRDLLGKLACGCEHEGAWASRLCPVDARYERDAEGERLA